jgi:hypothetical protein
MVFWIKRFARILSIVTFFIVFFLGLDPSQPFDLQIASLALFKGLLGALLFWFAGFILADIVLKGLIAGVPTNEVDAVEGGLLQRIHDEQVRGNPDSKAGSPASPAQGNEPKKKKKD